MGLNINRTNEDRLSPRRLKYRPEVDGLRAIAVIPVVLYHAGFSWFGGGYIGVDVFFVISGYLITSIILAEKTAGTFTITGFYERRARRILPALFFILLICLPFSWYWMTPHHMKGFAQSIVAVSVFLPNIYFFLKSSYFDIDADEKPLLHTWSLGVEEQYYFIFPLFILLFWRWGLKRISYLLMGISVVSLGFSEWASHYYPVANFFLAPLRAWELALGSLLGISEAKGTRPRFFSPAVHNLAAIIGALLVLIPVFLYKETTPFPGLYAVAPTLGACLIIFCADDQTIVGRILSWKPVTGIGLISYSLYLWHQPVFAFERLYSVGEPVWYLMSGLAVLSVVLAYLSWRYIEKPFRNRNRFSRQQIFGLAAFGSTVFIAIGLVGHFKEGFPERLNQGQQEIMAFADNSDNHNNSIKDHCFLSPEQDNSSFNDCNEILNTTGNTVFLWGDSHAAHLYPGLLKNHSSVRQLTTLTAGACPPLLNFGSASCQSINNFVLSRILREQPDRVILAAVWGNYHWELLKNTIVQLKNAGIKDIQLVGPVPRWIPSLPVVLIRYGVNFSEIPERISLGMDPTVKQLDDSMRGFAGEYGLKYISPNSILCNDAGCLVKVGLTVDSMMQWDVSHLTKLGSEFLVTRFQEQG